ncbi:hypothetical protein TKK_0015654 [Trichogramma kaykai]|uniref:Uncharacterized protein n=1 Tax=Trichogramma kaykai TaxID=54128 RepID=A0ABD2WAQ4_9HYME
MGRSNAIPHKKAGRPPKKTNLSSKGGRKKKDIFDPSVSVSERTIYRRAEELTAQCNYNIQIIELALTIAKKQNGIDSRAVVVSEKSDAIKHNEESALAIFLDLDFSVYQYKNLTADCLNRNCRIFPNYNKIAAAKKNCLVEILKNSESEVMVSLQNMLNKSIERLCELKAKDWSSMSLFNLEFIVSLGFDSSSGHVSPNQVAVDQNNNNNTTQVSLFVSCLNIIQMSCTLEGFENEWINPTPQSIRFTRPLRMSFEKENNEAINQEIERINYEIDHLKVHNFKLDNDKTVRFKYDVYKTLFDGKCVNTLVKNNATCRCPMCLKTTHQFGNPACDFTPLKSSLSFGLSSLHAEIKVFEHLLHISYRLELGEWDIRADMQDRFKERKKKIQDILYTKIGVKVDLCLQGHGTTNTGNVARRCFENSELFAECLEINSVLVKNLAHILLCFKSKKELDLDKLEKLCIETYWLHYSSYEWSRMNPSTHKLLMHGCQICRQFPLPIAYFSEDSSEAWHKLNRSNLKSGSRQCSREYRLLDTFNKAVYLSDPKISMTHVADRLKFRKNLDAPEEVKEFFIRTPTSQDEDIMEID